MDLQFLKDAQICVTEVRAAGMDAVSKPFSTRDAPPRALEVRTGAYQGSTLTLKGREQRRGRASTRGAAPPPGDATGVAVEDAPGKPKRSTRVEGTRSSAA